MERCGPARLEAMGKRILALQERNYALDDDLIATRAALHQARRHIGALEEQLRDAREQNARLIAEVRELKERIQAAASAPPAASPQAIGKANVLKKHRLAPGRKPGHPAAFRAMPPRINTHVDVPAPKDHRGHASCPECHAQLQNVQKHKRIVEDLIPAKKLVICYHTRSGYCPGCRKRVESRHPDQPPLPAGAEIHQPQLGINSLATVVLLRLRYRLPYRQIEQLLLDLPGMSIGAGAMARQIQRMASWLNSQYDRLKVLIRASPCVHMDETSWRIDGQNHWLWTMLSDRGTLYHLDKSRGQKVTGALLGDNFSGTLVSDFYSAYAKIDCPKQKCLVHLLRELKTTSEKSPAFAEGAFNGRLSRLLGQMQLLKKNKTQLEPETYERKVRKLERRFLELERGGWKETHAKRLAKRLRGHHGELTTFLRNDQVEGNNNAAERALRPVVVMRKITGGSRSEAGARATAVLQSILQTAMQQKCPLFQSVKTLLAAHWAGENPALLTDIFRNMA
jgi:hypothetical protein